jgi:hypothetical protein
VDADHLRAGDQLLADNGSNVTFTAVATVPGAADMWDLTINGVHDFYITTGASTVLVHNCPVPPRDVHSIVRSMDHGLEPDEYNNSFSAAKRGEGSLPNGEVYDHVVEQSQMKASRSGFSPQEIHNSENLNPVSSRVNQIKANVYSSIRSDTNGLTVRDYLNGKSFDYQFEYGMNITRQILNGEIG